MSLLTQTYIPFTSYGVGEFVDINSSLTGSIGGFPIVGGTWALFGVVFAVIIAAGDSCFFTQANTPVSLPPTADPPFPPVWPYLFSTDNIYGRDHLSTNLKMIRGDTYIFELAVILNGEAVDLTGGTLTMTAKWDIADSDANAVFQISTTSGDIVVTDAVGGLATVTISHAKTVNLPSHVVNLVYDIQLLDVNTQYFTVLTGILSVYPDSTTT